MQASLELILLLSKSPAMISRYNTNIVQKKNNIEVNILCEIQFSPPYLNFMHMGGLCESMSVKHVHAVFESEAR